MEKYVITGGMLVRADGVLQADIALENGRIAAIGEGLPTAGARVVTATGCYVLPGGVDVRTRITRSVTAHGMACDTRDAARDLWHTATLAAAYGGTTCIAEEPDPAAVATVRDVAQGNSVTDYVLYTPLPAAQPTATTLSSCCMASAQGLDDGQLLDALAAGGADGAVLRVHCRNKAMDAFSMRRLQDAGSTGIAAVSRAFSPVSEAEAVHRLLALAHAAEAPVCVAQVSTAAAAQTVRAAQAAGQRVYADTCPQYVLLDAACYAEGVAEGLKYLTLPPLRQRADCLALWEALKDGTVSAVASDHCATTYAAKWEASQGNIFTCPYGMPGVETRVPLLFAHGVRTGRLTLSRFVALVATTPADLLGLPHKGRLDVGADADVVVFNPAEARDLTAGSLHQGTDYTPFEGMKVHGWPQHVWLRGTRIIEEYAFTGAVAGAYCPQATA